MTQTTEAPLQSDLATLEFKVASVNLLPPEILEKRKSASARNVAIAMVALSALAVTGVFAWSLIAAGSAEKDLEAEQQKTAGLNSQAAKYAEVPKILAQVESAKDAQATAMGREVLWYRYLNNLALTYPDRVWLTTLTVNTASSGAQAAAGPFSTAGVGSISVTGQGYKHSDVAAWLDMLARTKGVADGAASNSAVAAIGDTAIVNFSSTATLTADSLSKRYERKGK